MNEELFELVRKRLPRRWRNFLRLYVSVGSSFDWWHGIDAFFYVNDRIVTLDVTLNRSKGFKADFRVTKSEMDPEKGRIAQGLAEKIAGRLMQKRPTRKK